MFFCPSSFSVLPQSRCQDNDSAGDGGLALPLETNKVFALWVDSSYGVYFLREKQTAKRLLLIQSKKELGANEVSGVKRLLSKHEELALNP